MKKFYDTCALLNLAEKAFQEPFVISVFTLYELESIKTSRNKDAELKYAARKVCKLLDENTGNFEVVFHEIPTEFSFYEEVMDSKICGAAAYYNTNIEPILFVSDDIACRCIAREVYCLESVGSDSGNEVYTGYLSIEGSSEFINDWFSTIDYSTLYPNQYLLISNTETGASTEMRFDGEQFVNLTLPPARYLKGKNSLQRCAIDLMMNSNIDIAVIMGTYGSGKSYLATQMALYHVLEKGH